MKKIIIISLALVLSGFNLINAQTINSEKSVVSFEIGNMKFKTVEGTFTGMTGDIEFDIDELINARFEVCIDAATVNTGNKKRDDHLRNEDFFHVEQYPEICFTSASIRKAGSEYLTKGTLSMHGVKKTVEIPFSFVDNTFTGRLSLDRFDYNIGEGTNTFMVAKEVVLTIVCVVDEKMP